MENSVGYLVEGALFLSLVGLIWKVGADNSQRSNTLFRRFDDYKKEVKSEHVVKDVCKIVHENLNRDIQEIKSDLKKLLNRHPNGGE